VPDALVRSPQEDATGKECSVGVTAQREVARSVELLGRVDAPLIGAVITGVAEGSSDAYGYGYYTKGSASPRQRQGDTVGNAGRPRRK